MTEYQTSTTLWMSLPLAVGLAVDATVVAASISASLPRLTHRHAFRLSWHFGLFQFAMPILGWLLGTQVIQYIDGWDHWAAFALLAGVGGHMVYGALKDRSEGRGARSEERGARDDTTRGREDAETRGHQEPAIPSPHAPHPSPLLPADPTRGWSLVVLSIGTSLDALAVGLALPLMHVKVWLVVSVIGVVTSLLVLVGMFAGKLAGTLLGRAAEVIGGLVLVGMGLKILVQGL